MHKPINILLKALCFNKNTIDVMVKIIRKIFKADNDMEGKKAVKLLTLSSCKL